MKKISFFLSFFFFLFGFSIILVENSLGASNTQECINNGYDGRISTNCYKKAGNIYIFSSSTSYAVDNCKNSDWTQIVACPNSYKKPENGCIVSDYDKSGDLCVAKTPTCTITKAEAEEVNPADGLFNHVLYGTFKSDGTIKHKISNSNGEIPNERQEIIFPLMENLDITGSWQKYDASDDSEPNNAEKDTATTDADPVDTKYFVYGDKPRYALTTIKNAENNFAGYNIYSLTCNQYGELVGTQTPVTGMCQNTNEVWNSTENTCQVPPKPECGKANGDEYFQTAEEFSYSDKNLCSVGEASEVRENTDEKKWEWSCTVEDTTANCSANVQYAVDLVMVNKNTSNPNTIEMDEKTDLNLAIGVNGCYNTGNFNALTGNNACNNSQHLAGKMLKVQYSWDSSKFNLVLPEGSANFSGTQPTLHWNNTDKKFQTSETHLSCTLDTSTDTSTLTCQKNTHTSIDKGIGTFEILDEIQFTPNANFSGNSNITFKTWTDDQSIFDDGVSFPSGFDQPPLFSKNSNNVVTFPFALLKPEVSVSSFPSVRDRETTLSISEGFHTKIYHF